MRWLCAALVAAWAIPPTTAAPVPASAGKPPPVSATLQAESPTSARQLLNIANQITEHYVRPVKREALLTAALTGLYERARLSVPEAVIEELKASQGDEDVLLLLARTRGQLGEI